ncbi:MAG: hypothetical protein HKN03_16390 [Acidimicrobiales bacterium]|nr:hypothetical protein [Acidimicrobiales bacterium]
MATIQRPRPGNLPERRTQVDGQRQDRRQRQLGDRDLPSWPITAAFALIPLWFLLGLHGFMWLVLAVPITISLLLKPRLVIPKGSAWWMLFLAAVLFSALSLDSPGRAAGWALRLGYATAAFSYALYALNGGRTLTVWHIVRALTWLWMGTVAGGFLAFVIGTVSYRAPLYYLFPGVLLENDLIRTLVTPSFADVQDIIGFSVPRPKAPYDYTNTWGSMLALLTPFAFISLSDRRAGFSSRLIGGVLVASIVPGVLSLNRGLWLSLGIGVVYVALRLGVLGDGKLIVRGTVVACFLVAILGLSPLGDVALTRIDTGHSNGDRTELIVSALDGTAERPLFGWGAPRPNRRGLPSVGTHGQLWYLLFSHGVIGAMGYIGFFASATIRSWRQTSSSGIWLHSVLIILAVQSLFYLTIPTQLFLAMVTAMLAIRAQREL